MKKTAAAVILLALVTGGSPALLGVLAQSRITTLATTLGDETLIRLAVTDYRRGWRSSHATIAVAPGEIFEALPVDPFDRGLLDQSIDVTVDITHGPVFADGGVGIGVADAVLRVDPRTPGLDTLLAVLGMDDPGEVRARIGFSSETSLRWALPPMAVAMPAVTFNSSGIVGQGTFNTARQRQVGETRVDRIELAAADTAFTAEDLAVALDLTRIAPFVWTGSTYLSVGRVQGTATGSGVAIAADHIALSGQSELNEAGDRIDGSSAMFADSLSVGGMNVTDARFDMSARNLSLDALIDYQEFAMGFLGADPVTLDPEALVLEVERLAYRLIEAEPELTYGPISFNLNGGASNATVNIRFDNEMLPAQSQFTLLNSSLWPRLISVDAELDVDRDLAQWITVRVVLARTATPATAGGVGADVAVGQLSPAEEAQARGVLIGLVSQGMLEETESGYRFRGSYDNGMIEVNGSVLPMGPAAPGMF